jgi:predicted transcriptional regulator
VVLEAGKVVKVVENGEQIGVVGKTEVLAVIAGAQ